ncbi:hypothetical protein SAY87_031487 [Trapa incisa]|uniref:Mitochondrial glycoprotein n=1 Tax=Trapa incisa TaxID=236973 RepID=A0AAN7KQB4_9MYRT|nr:hypothetical protein SAY87_031487 [Trapa incisa]
MARLTRCLRDMLVPLSSSPRLSLLRIRTDGCMPLPPLMDASIRARNFVHSAAAIACMSETSKSPFYSNIIRILRGEINYELELELHRLPKQVDEYKFFIVEDRPGEQWISLKRKYGDNEDHHEAADADGNEAAMQLHITVLVSISKGETGDIGLDEKLQNSLYEYLERRGVSDELAGFLHDYMWNKDKIDAIRWMRTVESFLEK